MANELQRNNGLFGDMMQDWFDNNFFNNANWPFNSNYMKTDIEETAKQYRVKVDMPGFDKKDIHISYNDDLLTVTGHRDTFDDESDKDGNILHSERRYGQMSRQYRLPGVDLEKVNAKYTDGVLILTLPKLTKQANDGKHIEID
ncbi:Hsp20/alpha crystallin family protein [Limosilactobacillus fermentum]|uniref:Hsp20/alpha crystallin family protein n=1 Tax=Limosilactobacillus fermentum TaxID=1613 RepID=UPI0030D3394A